MTQNRSRSRPAQRPRASAAGSRSASVVSYSPQAAWIGPPPRSHPAFGALLLLALPVLLVVLGVVIALFSVVALGVVLGLLGVVVVGANLASARTRRVVGKIDSRAADSLGEAGLINLVEGLCLQNGLSLPELRVIEDDAANLILLGGSADETTLFCTTGLLQAMDRIELEGLIADELAHERRDQVNVAALSMLAVGSLALFWTGTARLVLRLAGPERNALADQTAVAMTCDPPGLLEALDKLQGLDVVPRLSPQVARLSAGLWCVPLPEASGNARPGELALSERIAALAEL